MPVSVRLRDRSYYQSLIDDFLSAAEPLTEEEREEKAALVEQVFTNWNKPELRKFLELSGRYGRTAHAAIAAEMDNKTEEDVETYAEVFWQRYKEIPGEFVIRVIGGIAFDDVLQSLVGWEGYMRKYDDEEKRREKLKQDKDLLFAKISGSRFPLQKLDISYGQNKGKQYSEDEDRFLLVRLNHYGLERDYAYDMMKRDIGEWPDFR
jgi:SWI/SNF-related matrix-associated actin-dependent regulator of chromatin subfamily A member 5